MSSKASKEKKKDRHDRRKRKKVAEKAQSLKHLDTFYNYAPPGLIKEDEHRPEDTIPDCPENAEARDFLSKAPTKGLWMPLGKEVKVMKCWRCKTYGHRTGDKECPMFEAGNQSIEKFRYMYEDPMHNFVQENKRKEKEERIKELQALLESSDERDSSDSSSGDQRKAKKRKKHKREKDASPKSKKSKHKSKTSHKKKSKHKKDKD